MAYVTKFPELISFEKEYSTFLQKSIGKTDAQKIVLWKEEIESKHQNYYDDVIYRKNDDSDWKSKRLSSIQKFLSKYDDIAADTLKEFSVAKTKIQQKLPLFFDAFPDADFSGQKVYIVPALFRFNGQGTKYNSKTILSFGVDFIVLLNKFPTLIPGLNSSYNPDVFYMHEIFHLYHADHFLKDLEQEKTLLIAAWEEGLASYVSGEIAPEATLSEVLMDNNLNDCLEKRDFYLRSFKEDMYKCDDESYKKWFLISSTDKVIPKRAGYCVGYLLAKELSQKYSLLELSKLSWSKNTQEAKTLLK